MGSINRNQPEKNRQNLQGEEAIRQIKTIVGQAQNCFFCTTPLAGNAMAGESNGSRPMNVRHIDDAGNLWFLSAADSQQNQELERDSTVRLYFQGSPHSDFLLLAGEATVSRDKAKIAQLWEPLLKTWFTEGQEDPRITVIRFVPTSGYYWDTKHGNLVAGIKMMLGAALGKTLDDSIEGKLQM
jgi:general stress protein 26